VLRLRFVRKICDCLSLNLTPSVWDFMIGTLQLAAGVIP